MLPLLKEVTDEQDGLKNIYQKVPLSTETNFQNCEHWSYSSVLIPRMVYKLIFPNTMPLFYHMKCKSWPCSFHFQQYFSDSSNYNWALFFCLNYSSNLGIALGSKSYAYFHVRPSNPWWWSFKMNCHCAIHINLGCFDLFPVFRRCRALVCSFAVCFKYVRRYY